MADQKNKEQANNENRVIDMRSAEQKVASAIQDHLFKDTKPDRILKGIDLCFENVEAYSIPADAIQSFWIDNLHHNLSFDATRNDHDRFTDDWRCDALDMVLDFNVINKIKTWQSDTGNLDNEKDRMGLGDRILRYNDLVNVDLHFTDGSHQNVFVKYDDPFGHDENLLMRSALGQDRKARKILYIYIH